MRNIVLKTPFIELDVKVDIEKLLQEYNIIEKKHSFKRYKTNAWPVRRKYAKSWSGICLISSDGGLYSDMYEGNNAAATATELKDYCPYMYQLIKELGGAGHRARIMRISPKKSLVWHSHVHDHGQEDWTLTVQVPIIVPKEFEYCVVDKDEFKWYKRFHRPSWFNNIHRKRLEPGKAYIFNSYHYHNVYNYSKEYRATLMLYLDLRDQNVYSLIEKSLKRLQEHDIQA